MVYAQAQSIGLLMFSHDTLVRQARSAINPYAAAWINLSLKRKSGPGRVTGFDDRIKIRDE
jgi:hypothetical protein